MRSVDVRPAGSGAGSNFLPTLSLGIAWCAIALHVLAPSQPVSAQTAWVDTASRSLMTLQQLVDDLKTGLAISQPVAVSVVPSNKLVMSVAAPAIKDGPFHLSIDATVLGDLSDDELSAAVAHELGHVWVFTHHPYLQTERLANEIAMRVVSRDSLERLYSKVWAHGGTKGDILSFLGPPPAAPTLVTVPASTSTDARH